MADDIPEIEDDPKSALKSFIGELETYYYPWYDKATTRDYYAWSVAQALSLVAGFCTAVLAALLREEQFRSWTFGRVLLVVLPLVGSVASTFLVQSRIAELEALREKGRETTQRLANQARVDYAAATSREQYTDVHQRLVSEVSALEQEQSRGFHRIIPKPLTLVSHGTPRARK